MKNHELSKKIVMYLICITTIFFFGCVKAVDENNVSCPYLYKKVVIENTTLCLKLKKEESYMNKYTGCNGNAVPINFSYLVSSNNINTSTTLYWTDYRRAYDDGPIIKWRHEDPDMGQPLLLDLVDGYSGYQNKINTSASACLAIDIKSQKFVTRDCDDKLYRLCIVKPIKPYDSNHTNDAVYEHPVEKPRMSLKIYSEYNPKWKLFVSIECEESILVSPSDIICFTDSARFYPTKVNVTNLNQSSHFSIETGADGYYWCISNTTKWEYNISRKFFFINKIHDLKEIYDIEFNFPKPINISDVENHYFLQLQNLFKSYEREIDLSKYILKKVYINGGVIYRGNISYYEINDHGSIYVNMPEIVRIDSPLCFPDSKSIAAADDNIPLENNYSEECKYEPHCNHCKYSCVKSGKINRYGWESKCPKIYKLSFVPYTEVNNMKDIDESIHSFLDGNVTERIEEKDIHKVVDNLNRIISNSTENVSNEITKKIDEILFKVDIKNRTFYYPSKHIIVGAADTGEQNASLCILVNNITSDDMTNSNIKFSINAKAKLNCGTEVTNDTDIMVDISNSINFNGKLVVAVMDKEKFFQPDQKQTIWKINSKIISICKSNMTLFNDKQYIDIHLKSNENECVKCVFWDYTLFKNGGWSSKGSEMFRDKITGMVTCRWNHLTHFALLMQSKTKNINNHYWILSVITYCGCAALLIGLIVICNTAILFERWKKELTNKEYLNLSVAIGLMLIIFLGNIFLKSSPKIDTICPILGPVVHYSVLSTFIWMLITAVLSYRKLMYVSNTNSSHRLLKSCICGWIFPLVLVLPLVFIDPTNYNMKNTYQISIDEKNENNPTCYDSIEQSAIICYPNGLGFWLTVFLPIFLIVIINSILFFHIVFKVKTKATLQQLGHSKFEETRSATVGALALMGKGAILGESLPGGPVPRW
ncbi:uncharacterized protein LOC143915574 [Arctopsyche grandis]|uniref:uncharacterized protein LOC143915574 n=1 Tax=Arctopsyche grandis TaxID=121162 RepID=UPI00406D7784